jgi:hypothetical protein
MAKNGRTLRPVEPVWPVKIALLLSFLNMSDWPFTLCRPRLTNSIEATGLTGSTGQTDSTSLPFHCGPTLLMLVHEKNPQLGERPDCSG